MGSRLLWMILPAVVLALAVAGFTALRPLDGLVAASPPVEQVAVERTRLVPGAIELGVRADGSKPVGIAQVQVDGAYRTFAIDPAEAIGRLSTARITIPYHWIDGETHHVVLVTSTGVTFEHTIDVATESPQWQYSTLLRLGFVGLVLGLVPVVTGLLAYPALASLGAAGLRFLLALTVGLLAFLLIDTLREGLEAGARALERLHGSTVVWVSAATTAAVLLAFGRRSGRVPEGAALATFVALGIGLHNLGEGLAVGSALSTGAAALASFLLVGFVIHNVTEGIGIAAPLVGTRPSLALFAGLAGLAGLPALAGVLLGAGAVSPLANAVCLGVGVGAIFQVMVEVTALMVRRDGTVAMMSLSGAGGFVAGLAIMYLTALLV